MSQQKSKPAQVLVITGQTATGKTAQAVKRAREIEAELVNADGRHIYQGLNIVTGKDRPPADVPIHLLDLIAPDQSYSPYAYVQAAIPVLCDIIKRGKTPIIVGGTYLYLKHLLYPQPRNPGPDPVLRDKLNQKPVSELQAMLHAISPETFQGLNRSDKTNPHRLIRKIEIIRQQGSEDAATNSDHMDISSKLGLPVEVTVTGYYHADRSSLEQAIERRIAARVSEGAVSEVQTLLDRGLTGSEPGLSGIGYPQLIEYIHGKTNWENTIQSWKTKEIQYAKRQYTFMKRDATIVWNKV